MTRINTENLFVTRRKKFNGRWSFVRVPKKLTTKQKEILRKELEGLTTRIVLRKLRSESKI